tara:strand:+ start:1423 stop:3066 length:1644 start_codon:yes stop_codon:yes gene_type:complete
MNKKNFEIDKKNIINLFNKGKFNKISKYSKSIIDNYKMDIYISKLVIAAEINLKNYSKAEKYLEEIIIHHKSDELYYLFGNILKMQNKLFEAIDAYKKAIILNDKFSPAYNNLANIQKILNDNKTAVYNYNQAINSDMTNHSAYFNLANLYRSEKKYEKALDNYQKVLKLNPKFVEALYNVGSVQLILGNFEVGLEYLKKTIQIDRFHSESYFNYISAKKITKNDQVFLNLKNFIEIEKLSEVKNFKMYYSLSKSYFDLENHELGFKYLKLANDFKLNEMEYSFKKQSKNFKKIKEYFYGDIKKKELPNLNKSIPIFILGMPRSGTSLIEQIISNHSKVYGGGELNLLPISVEISKWEKNENIIDILQIIRNEYLKRMSELSDKKYITDKLPGNFKWIGFIVNAIPESKIIHLERNPMATCWSIYKSNFDNPDMGFTCKQEYIAEFYVMYKDLMNFWKTKYPNKFININYEGFVEDNENNIKKMFQNLELSWENHLLSFYNNKRPVETSSFQQVRKKIFKNSSEEWKKYKKYLGPMMEILSKNKINF